MLHSLVFFWGNNDKIYDFETFSDNATSSVDSFVEIQETYNRNAPEKKIIIYMKRQMKMKEAN